MFFRSSLIVAALAAFAIFAPAAGADINGTGSGGTTDLRPGSHGDLTTRADLTYSNNDERLRRVIIDTPGGGVGNPNAIPWEERCPVAEYEADNCPESSQIGVVNLDVLAYLLGTALPGTPLSMSGDIYQLQIAPEIPTKVGAVVRPVAGDKVFSQAEFYPVTSGPDGDFRIRSVTSDFPTEAHNIPVFGNVPIQVTKYEQVLYGKIPATGRVFITAPPRCDDWLSWGYAQKYGDNPNANSDPLNSGANEFVKTDVITTVPDCNAGPLPSFASTSVEASVEKVARGASPTFTTTVKIPDIGADPIGPAIPKKIVATLPDALNVDVQQLGRVCTVEQFEARSCPANTKVGTVEITTPLVSTGLTGSAHLVKAPPGSSLPNLGLIVGGMIEFTQLGTNKYVGNGTQIQTTFDNIPQPGFTSFKLTITGGSGGLLRVDTCPTNGRTPLDGGPVKFDLTSYTGDTKSSQSGSVDFGDCTSYSVKANKFKRCLKKRSLKIRPKIKSPGAVSSIQVSVKGQKAKKDKRAPFRFTYRLSKKLKAGKTYRYKLKVTFKPTTKYPKGRSIKKTGRFKICR